MERVYIQDVRKALGEKIKVQGFVENIRSCAMVWMLLHRILSLQRWGRLSRMNMSS